MPGMRYIALPAAVQLVNPVTKEPFPEEKPITYLDLLHKLLSNPKWAESYLAIKSADAIMTAFTMAVDGLVTLAEDDWARLKDAVENPKIVAQAVHGQVILPGYGYHPMVARQILPLLKAIVEAKDKAPSALKSIEG